MRRVVFECVYLVFGRFVARGAGEVWQARWPNPRVFVYLCICVFGLCGAGEEVWPGDLTPVYLCIVYLCTRVFVYLVFGRSGAGGGGEVRPARWPNPSVRSWEEGGSGPSQLQIRNSRETSSAATLSLLSHPPLLAILDRYSSYLLIIESHSFVSWPCLFLYMKEYILEKELSAFELFK